MKLFELPHNTFLAIKIQITQSLIPSFCVFNNAGSSDFNSESEQFFPLPTFSAAQTFPVTTFTDQTGRTNNTHSPEDINAPQNVSSILRFVDNLKQKYQTCKVTRLSKQL